MQLRLIVPVALAFASGCHAQVGAGIGDQPPSHSSAAVRYEVSQIEPAVAFYKQLGFVVWKRDRASAVMHRGDLTLLLDSPRSPGARPATEAVPEESNVWNRIVLFTDDLVADRNRLENAGIHVGMTAYAGDRIIVRDPDGNPVELRQTGPRVAYQ